MRAGLYLCLLASSCLAQSGSLEGELSTQKPADFSHLLVRLETSGQGSAEHASVSANGDFRFCTWPREVIRWWWRTKRQRDYQGNRSTFFPSTSNSRCSCPKIPPPGARKGPSRCPNCATIPTRVRGALKAQKLSESGDYRGAAAQLEKAVAMDPQ